MVQDTRGHADVERWTCAVSQVFDKVSTQELDVMQIEQFLDDHTSEECVRVGFDCCDSLCSCLSKHIGVTALQWPKLENITAGQITYLINQPLNPPILEQRHRACFEGIQWWRKSGGPLCFEDINGILGGWRRNDIPIYDRVPAPLLVASDEKT